MRTQVGFAPKMVSVDGETQQNRSKEASGLQGARPPPSELQA